MLKRYTFIPIFLILVLVLWALPALAEMIVDTAWVRSYNAPADSYDWAMDMVLDSYDNAYVTGISWNGTGYDYATIKYYPNGDTAWVRRFHGGFYDEACGVAVDSYGNVYVAGRIVVGSYWDYLTIKYYPDGDTAWVKRYNGPGNNWDWACGIAVDGSDNVFVTGCSFGNGTNADIATIKYFPNGDTVWVRRYNGPPQRDDDPIAFKLDNAGNAYVTGGSSDDFVTIKYYPNGDTAWVRMYNGPANSFDWGNAIAVDKSQNVYVTGPSWGMNYDILTIKYFPDGDTGWVRRYNGPGNDYDASIDIAVDDSGNVFVVGATVGDGYDLATIKYYPNGDTAWVRTFDGPGTGYEEFALAVYVDNDGNIYVSGFISGETDRDNITIKYYPNGDTAWVKTFSGTGGGFEWATDLALDSFGDVYVTGGATSDDYITIKYYQVLRADMNRDGVIDIGDVIYLINYLYRDGPSPQPLVIGDATCGGEVDVSDIVFLINYLFKGGPPPSC